MSRFQIRNGYGNRSKVLSHPIYCSKCRHFVMAEYEPIEGLTALYDFDPYTKNIKILHQDPADAKTRNISLEIVAVEKRLLDDPDPNDWIYIPGNSLDFKIVGEGRRKRI